ncbi:NADH-quinone oxidoreductase subunit C [Streptomyces cinereoruber]|uniref:NADH-quinone oxidoreductase subunit C n=1 Tax=Streptomyces cinereoruber TaxID=67260 RepID=UPI003C2DBEC8
MSAYGDLPESVTEVFGEEATAERAYDLLTVDVPPSSWITALTTARDELGCTYFDWLSAVDEPGTGIRVCAHVVALGGGGADGGGPPRRLLVRTTVPHAAPVLPTAVEVYAGAGWHERETHEMFGVDFTGHPNPAPLLLPENFEGHPLRKDFVLAARVAKAWPGAKEPGESHDGGPKRRQMLPPGVPDPNEWGPLKGQLPPAPTRPERPPRRPRPTTETTPPDPTPRRTRSASEGSASQDVSAAPVRRTRSASDGSASQETPASPPRRTRSAADGSASQTAGEPGAPARRTRSASEGSASQDASATPVRGTRSASDGSVSQTPAGDATGGNPPETPRPPRRSRSASDGSVSQSTAPDATADTPPETPRPPRRSRSAADGSVSQTPPPPAAPRRTRSSDAPWHHARPAFDEEPEAPDTAPTGAEGPEKDPGAGGPGKEKPTGPGPDTGTDPDPTHPAGGDPA